MKNNKSSSFVNEIFHPRTKVLNEILDKFKTHGDKRGLGYINKDETKIVFVKGKEKTPNQIESSKNTSLCTHCKKTRHFQFRCYTRFLA